jgi:outer membrane murein-binding lipoprotein Lpp
MEKEILEILKRLENKIDGLENRFDKLENKVDALEQGQKENYQILRGLEERTVTISAEQHKMSNDMIHMQGDIEAIKKNLLNVESITAKN